MLGKLTKVSINQNEKTKAESMWLERGNGRCHCTNAYEDFCRGRPEVTGWRLQW